MVGAPRVEHLGLVCGVTQQTVPESVHTTPCLPHGLDDVRPFELDQHVVDGDLGDPAQLRALELGSEGGGQLGDPQIDPG